MQRVRLGRVTVTDSLANEIELQIQTGELQPGTRLPGEATLAAQFGVSRPIVREALGQLRERGYVTTVNGRGTFVRHPDATTISTAIERHLLRSEDRSITVDHLYEAREAIEVTSARLAATRADQASRAQLVESLEQMRQGRDDRLRYSAADMDFHIGLARASGNPLLPSLLTPLAQTIITGMLKSHSTPTGVDRGIAMHTEILERILDRDGQGAAEAMARHLAESRQLFPKELLD